MLEVLRDLPANVVGVVASGKVTAGDYESVLIPAIESALKAHGSVHMLYQLGPAFSGFTPGAMWDDLKVGVAHLKAWKKIAVVTDVDWVAGATRIFAFTFPCPVRVFSNDHFGDAVRWVAAA